MTGSVRGRAAGVDVPSTVEQQILKVNELLATQEALPTKLEAVAEILERTVPGCDAVSIALVIGGGVSTVAASDQLAIEADLVQYAFDQGPCLTAARRHATVRVDLMAAEERYAHFAPGAIELGVESVLSIPLVQGSEVVGSINLYSCHREAFDTDEVTAALRPLTEYAAELIAGSPIYDEARHLAEEVIDLAATRDVVAQATGILRVWESATEEVARRALDERARRLGVSVIEAARAVVAAAVPRSVPAEPGPGEPGEVAPHESGAAAPAESGEVPREGRGDVEPS